MATVAKRFAKIGALLAISSMALVGCTATISDPAPSQSEQLSKSADRPADEIAAASFANEFFAVLIEEDATDYKSFTPPIELTEAQAQQLMLDGKVDGVSDEELKGLVDFLYENHPLGDYVYFSETATIQQRLQVISALILAKNYAGSMMEEQTPEKIVAEDVALEKREGSTYATLSAEGSALAPVLILVDGQWAIDGETLLQSFGADAPGDPIEESSPAPSE